MPRDARHTCARLSCVSASKTKAGRHLCGGYTHGARSTQRSQGNKGPGLAVGGRGRQLYTQEIVSVDLKRIRTALPNNACCLHQAAFC